MSIDDETLWMPALNGNYASQQGNLATIKSPNIINASFMRITVQSATADEDWWLAGTATQIIENTIFPGSDFELKAWRIRLNHAVLLDCVDVSVCKIKFEPVFWLKQVDIFLEKYIG